MPAYRAIGSRAPKCSEADTVSDFTTKKALVAFAPRAKGGWMRGCVPSRGLRRTASVKSLGAGELRADQLVDHFAVDALAGELRHRRLHHAPHVFGRRGASLGDRRRDGAIDCLGI